jgi:hypothetical protein
MINFIWIPLDSIWNRGISTLDSMEQVHMDSLDKSMWIPWNFWELFVLSKIVATARIEHSTLQNVTKRKDGAILQLYYTTVV